MRTSLWLAIGLGAAVCGAPAAFAQDSHGPDPGAPAGAGLRTGARQPGSLDGVTLEPRPNAGVFIEAPIGNVSVGPEFVDGAPVYVRRATAAAGITVVEISTSPFAPDPASYDQSTAVRPDQPASW